VSSAQRDPRLPDVPTTLEAGYANSEYNFWFGVFAPAKTPPAIVVKLSKEIGEVLKSPDVQGKLDKLTLRVAGGTPADAKAFISKETEIWGKVIKEAHVPAQ